MTGIVVSFDERKGYGFVKPLIGKPDTVEKVFFHISSFRPQDGKRPAPPPVGAELSFDLCRAEKGQQACNIEIRTQALKMAPAEL
jgi:cold shock CspA family protein